MSNRNAILASDNSDMCVSGMSGSERLFSSNDDFYDPAFDDPVTDYLSPYKEWPSRVDGDTILEDLYDLLNAHLVLREDQITAIALWIVHAHVHDAALHSPILTITSPTHRCGKSTLLNVLNYLVPKPLKTINTTPAGLFHQIEECKPTLLIDEADSFFKNNENLRGLLNASFEKRGAKVIRADESFSVWAPVVIGFKKGQAVLPDTLRDRSIIIELQRKLPGEWIKSLPVTEEESAELSRYCAMIARWAKDNMPELKKMPPEVSLKGLNDRANDSWRPLLKIAALAGDRHLAFAKKAALSLSGGESEVSLAELVLAATREVFEQHSGADRLPSELLVMEINANDGLGLISLNGGRPLTSVSLAHVLKPFGIKPRQHRFSGSNTRSNGYLREQFEDAWKRYI